MQYFTVQPLTATAGSPPGSTQAEAMVKGNDDLENYVENMLDLLRTGQSATSAKGPNGYTLTYTGGVGDDEDYWIADCERVETTHSGIHAQLGVRIDFTDGSYGGKAGSVQ